MVSDSETKPTFTQSLLAFFFWTSDTGTFTEVDAKSPEHALVDPSPILGREPRKERP